MANAQSSNAANNVTHTHTRTHTTTHCVSRIIFAQDNKAVGSRGSQGSVRFLNETRLQVSHYADLQRLIHKDSYSKKLRELRILHKIKFNY